MSHLRYSFFICSKPVDAGISDVTLRQVGGYYVGCAAGFLPVQNATGEMFFSLDTLAPQQPGASMHNTVRVKGDSLRVCGSHMNTQCVYYIVDKAGEHVAVFNDLFLARPLLQSLGYPVLYSNEPSQELTFFQHVQRLKAGQQLSVRRQGKHASAEVTSFSYFLEEPGARFRDIGESEAEFLKCLEAAVKHDLEGEWNVSIALSGGVDSGSIAALVKKHRPELDAYTVSTDWGDEYSAAKETADFLGIHLELVHLTKEEIISEVPNVIRFFHFTSPESIEIALVAHCLYKKLHEADGKKRTFLTGYGSDLLNAGVFSPFDNYDELHADCMRRVTATQLSNEFSNLAAIHHGVTVRHPFWHSAVINTALRVPAEFKVINGQDKFYFREMVKGLLPENTAWRKKLGAHHGTGLSQHLRHALGDGTPGGYQQAINKIHEEIFCYGNYNYQAGQASYADPVEQFV
jgi:asparagine synthetase B (glutamine-hydrolysing)